MIKLNVNVPSKSLTHILVLANDEAKDHKPLEGKEAFKNLDVTAEGKPNQLYTQGLSKEITWREITKLFKENGVSMGESLMQKYVLLLDLRPSVDNRMHGNGVELRNTTDGITIEIYQVAEAAKLKLACVFAVRCLVED